MSAPAVTISAASAWQCRTERAARLLEAAHERHCPMTPALAEGLVRIETSGQPALEPGWGRAFVLMGEAIGRPDLVGRSPFWTRGIPVFAARVAEPILRRAAERTGHLPLSGPVPLSTGVPIDPKDAQRQIETAVAQLLGQIDQMGRGFWVLAALSLQGAAQTIGRSAGAARDRRHSPSVLPEPDPVVGRLLFEVLPVFDEQANRRRQRKVKARSLRKRSGEKPKEGGVAGIRPSRQIDDMPDAVMSELVLPDPIVAYRLFNEGLLVRHRPPLREPKRDLLVVMALDRRADPGGLTAIVKAAWADAAIRLRIILASSGQERSDLLFAEQTLTRAAEAAVRVDDGQRVSLADPLALQAGDRARLILESRLLPGFVNILPQATAPAGPILPNLLAAAVRAMPPLALPTGRKATPEMPSAKDYARRLMIVCVPQSTDEGREATSDWSSFRGRLQVANRQGNGGSALHAALVVPKSLADGAIFLGQSDVATLGRVEIGTPTESPDDARLEKLMGDLSGWLIDLALGALDA